MKQKWFSPRLYVEGLRQLRLLGLLATIAVGLIVIFIPLGNYFSTIGQKVISVQTVTYDEMNPLAPGAFCAVAPLLMLSLFSFLNKREASDHYHAIPATRTCLFFSYFAAVATWLFIFTFGTALLSVAFHAIFPALFTVNYYSVLLMSINCFVGGILIAACVAIAMSATGTLVMNVLLALLLIFMPHILLELFRTVICDLFPPVIGLSFTPLLNLSNNIPAAFVLQYFFQVNENPLTSSSSLLYTTLIFVVYLIIAWRLFIGRRSEAAGHSAPSPHLQALYRFLVGFASSSLITLAFFMDIRGSVRYDISEIFNFTFLYVLSLFSVAVFELLCTRRFRGLLRRLLSTAICLIIANLLLIGGTFGGEFLLKSYAPNANQIQSVRIQSFGGYDRFYGDDGYYNNRIPEIDIRDDAVTAMVSKQLKYTLDILDVDVYKYHSEVNTSGSIVVSIKSGGVWHQRRILLSETDIELLAKTLSANKEYQQLFMNLPKTFSSIRGGSFFLSSSDESSLLFMNTLQAEINEIGFENWFALVNSSQSQLAEKFPELSEEIPIATLSILVPEDSGWSEIPLSLYPSKLPKTSALFLELHREKYTKDRDTLLSVLEDSDGNCEFLSIQMINSKNENGESYFYYDRKTLKDQIDVLVPFATALKAADNAPFDPSAPLCYLDLSCQIRNEDGYWDYLSFQGYFAYPENLPLPQMSLSEK